MLTGEVPRGVFQPPSRKSGSDARLDDVVQRALQERPEDRYQAASELKEDITGARAPKAEVPQVSRRRFPWAATFAVVLVIGAALMFGAWLIVRSTYESLSSGTPKTTFTTIEAPPAAKDARPLNPPVNVIPPITADTKPLPPTLTREKQVAKLDKPAAMPAPSVAAPSAPSASAVTAPSSKSTAKVWSINPLSPALSPPDEVMKQGWKDCVLLKD
jgi:hypothetical protein